MAKDAWKPARTIQECDAISTAPGQFHELVPTIIDGVLHKVYKNLWPSVRDFWLSIVTNNPAVHDREYIVFEDVRMTYGQADAMIQRMASVLHEVYNIKKGDRVGIAMRNYPEWIISFFAVGLLGAVPALLNAWLPIEPFLHCINLATPKLLILDSERLDLLDDHLNTLSLPVIVVWPSSNVVAGRHIQEWSKVLASYSGSTKAWEKVPEALPGDDATVFFTSGTTGFPKGVLSDQRGFLGNYFNSTFTMRRMELRRGQDLPPPFGSAPPPDTVPSLAAIVTVPLFHVTGCTSILINSTASGSKVVLMRKWDKDEAVKLIVKEKVNFAVSVPSVLYDLLETSAVGNKDLMVLGIGGAPPAASLPGELSQKFPDIVVQQGYGLSETNAIAVAVAGEDYLARPDSTGCPPANVDLLVVDPKTNKVLPPGHVGELWIRGPNVMRGYWNDPKATAEAITRGGWLKSGDLASIDDEGFVYIKDRAKDMIIRGGENIHSIMVENALFADERVLDCAAVGIPDKRLGELVGAAVVPRQEWVGKLNEADLLNKVKRRLPSFAVPSMIIIKNEMLERNAAGKVLKVPLRKEVAKEWEQRVNAKGKL